MTEPESRLWQHLKGKNLGQKFRRQHSIGSYIVDFYCPTVALIVEVDGDTHYEAGAIEYDRHRDEYLKAQGLQVLRFTNIDVIQNLDGVLETIIQKLTKTVAATPSRQPPFIPPWKWGIYSGRGRTGDV